jgi:hypothetical protein
MRRVWTKLLIKGQYSGGEEKNRPAERTPLQNKKTKKDVNSLEQLQAPKSLSKPLAPAPATPS